MKKERHISEKDMTTGPPGRLIFRFAIPLMVGNLFQQLYNLVDSIVIGRFVGGTELGGIGCTSSIDYLIFSLGYGVSSGIGIMVAILYGAREKERLTRAIYNGFYAILGASMVITALGYLGAQTILTWMNTPAEVFPYAKSYLQITMLGSTATMFYSAVSSVMRSFGDATTPLYILIFCCILNVVLDLVFVLCFKMSVAGVAWATVISQALSAVLGYMLACRNIPQMRCSRDALRVDWKLLRMCIRLAFPIAGQNVMIAASCIVLQTVVNGFGELVVTANMAVAKIEQLVQQPYGSLSSALSAFTGQNVGAHRTDRVRQGFRVGLWMMAGFSAIMVVVMQMFGRQILSVFVVETQIIEIGVKALRITSWFYVFLGLIYVARGILNGAGDTGYSAINGIVELVCRVGLAKPLTMIPFVGVWGCFLCSGLTWMTTGLLSLGRYLSGRWNRIGSEMDRMTGSKEG